MNDGGPAFPIGSGQTPARGMSLRDWFAGQALIGLMSSRDHYSEAAMIVGKSEGVTVEGVFAHWAGAQADAMLAEREKETT